LGNVVDMLYFPLIDSTWPDWVPVFGGDRLVFFRPIFNLADAAISVGVGLYVLSQWKKNPE
jgi:signal peptidase II